MELVYMSEEVQLAIVIRLMVFLLAVSLIALALLLYWHYYNRRHDKQVARMVTSLIKDQDELKRLDIAKSAFLNGISHAFRTPLNAIDGYLDLLLDKDVTTEEKEEYTTVIRENSDTLVGLVDNLLYISKEYNESFDINYSDFSVGALLDDVVASGHPSEGVAITKYCAMYEDTIIHSDRAKLVKILSALMDNACKFTSEGEIRIVCRYSLDQDILIFSVTDTGPGIPAHLHKDVFNKFTKLDSFSQGTGIGLYIASIVSHLLGGNLYIDETYTKGARFILELPQGN